MNSLTEKLAQQKKELADAWDTLTALQNTLTPLSDDWETLTKAKGLLVARVQTLSNRQEELNRKEYRAATSLPRLGGRYE